MVATSLDCPFPYFPIPYGCWCGLGPYQPNPHRPIDEFDAACKEHDLCYDEAVASGCDVFDEYFWNYSWSLTEDKEVRTVLQIF